jgi:hypothetical protein
MHAMQFKLKIKFCWLSRKQSEFKDANWINGSHRYSSSTPKQSWCIMERGSTNATQITVAAEGRAN